MKKAVTLILFFFCVISFYAAESRAQFQQFDTSHVFASSPSYDYRNIFIETLTTFLTDSLNTAYERHSPGRSDIITRRFRNQNVRPEIVLTNDSSININPSASRSMVVWESNKYGSRDIFFSTYNGTWSAPFACDTSSATQDMFPQVTEGLSNPRVYYIAYQKDDDIIVRTYSNGIKILDTNITVSDNNPAAFPVIKIRNSSFYIAYLSQTSSGYNEIVLKSANITANKLTWSQTNVIKQVNSASNLKFIEATSLANGFLTYDYDTLGTKHTLGIAFTTNPNPPREILSIGYTGINSGGEGAHFPILTNSPAVSYHTFAWHRKTADSSMVLAFRFFANNGSIQPKKRFFLGDSTVNTKIAMSDPILAPSFYRIRLIWEQKVNGKWALIESTFDNPTGGIILTGNRIPVKFSLHQNYPNPFNPSTRFAFELPESGFVSLKVFNSAGRQAASLINESLTAGSYNYTWDAAAFPSGVYYYTLASGSFSQTKKMVLLK